MDLIVYVVIRVDLKSGGWPLGAVIAQGVHASNAAMYKFLQHEHTQAYLKDSQNMHTAVLQVENQAALKKLAEKLEARGIEHVAWIEQPENEMTALATRPYPKSEVKKIFRGLRLMK